jgi:hypothetical protein
MVAWVGIQWPRARDRALPATSSDL